MPTTASSHRPSTPPMRLARANFKQAGLYLEKLVAVARHLEVQIFGDGAGKVLALGERDCSVQRRHQKVLEETPAPGLTAQRRESLLASATRLARAARYRSAGTVEFVLDDDQRRCLLPRGQHAHSGRARSHRRGNRCRSHRVDGAVGRGRAARSRLVARSRRTALPSRHASTPRIPNAVFSRARACSPTSPLPTACGSRPGSSPEPTSLPTTIP